MSQVLVAKFGGSSLASAEQFQKVKTIVTDDSSRRYVVPSAPGKRDGTDHKVTDLLYMCHQLASHNIDCSDVFASVADRVMGISEQLNLNVDMLPVLRTIYDEVAAGASKDFVASRGEYLSGLLLADYLGYDFVDAADVIRFNSDGTLNHAETQALLSEMVGRHDRAVIPGFYGADTEGTIFTFSRGGSDVTGAVVAAGVGADLYENWTDVSGFLKADPRIVDEPKPIERVTYKELRELAYMGAPVLHEEAIFPIRAKGVPIHIRNTNDPECTGTLIVDDRDANGFSGITGIAGKTDFAVISVEKTLMDDERGFLRKLVSVFETNGISISHIPSGIDSVSVLVRAEDIQFKLDKVLAELRIYLQPDSISVQKDIALLAVVGHGMISTPGIAGRVFGSLAKRGVNIRMISQGASELSIIIGIDNADFPTAVSAVYEVE